MKQPAGTITYKGHRKTVAGEESFEKDEKVLKKSGDFHAEGKTVEKAAEKTVKTETKTETAKTTTESEK